MKGKNGNSRISKSKKRWNERVVGWKEREIE